MFAPGICPTLTRSKESIMFRLTLALLLTLLAAGCANDPLPVASGPVRQLNVGRWTPSANDLTVPPTQGHGA